MMVARIRRPPTGPADHPAEASRPRGVSAALMKRLREEYGRGRTTDEGYPIGDHPEVRAWLESLEVRHGR